jgi:hypothetical protein
MTELINLTLLKSSRLMDRLKGFDFLGFQFSLEGMTISKKSVHKFAENIVLKLDTCIAADTGQISPGSKAGVCGNSGIYGARQLPG